MILELARALDNKLQLIKVVCLFHFHLVLQQQQALGHFHVLSHSLRAISDCCACSKTPIDFKKNRTEISISLFRVHYHIKTPYAKDGYLKLSNKYILYKKNNLYMNNMVHRLGENPTRKLLSYPVTSRVIDKVLLLSESCILKISQLYCFGRWMN